MHRLAPLFLLLALAAGCGEGAPAPEPGHGLALLTSPDPLPRGVEERDRRLNFWDFGRVTDGDTVVHVFQLRNEDPGAVTIKRVTPGCGCTVAALRAVLADGSSVAGEAIGSKSGKLLVVPAGALLEVEVKMATRDLVTKNADKLVTITVETDSPNGYYLSLEVHIFVEKAFNVVPAAIALGRIPENGGGRGKLDIVQAPGFDERVVELGPLPAGVFAQLGSEERFGRIVWTLEAGFEPPLARGPKSGTVRVETADAEGEPGRALEIQVSGQVVEDLTADPERLVFAAPRGESQSGTVEFRSLLAGQRLRVTGVELPEGQRQWLSATATPLEPDDAGSSLRWKLELTTHPPLPADSLLAGKLLVRLDDAQHPTAEVAYAVHLK